MNLFHKYYFEIWGEPVEPTWNRPEVLYSDFVYAVDLADARRKAYDEFIFHLPELVNTYHWWSDVEEVEG